MFNMLEIYRSRFTKRMRNRTQKRSNTAYSRADSICMANGSLMNSNVYGLGSILAMGPMPLERPISSSNSSLTTTNSLTKVPSPPKENSSTEKKRILPIQKILSLETDKFEYIINNLNLCDEDRLLNILTEYFLSKEDVNSFTCSSQTTGTSSEESRSSISSHYSLNTPSDEFQARRQNSGKKTLNRCYYASIQAHMALAFKSMDTNYDNKLSMDEFVIGIRATLNESCIRKLCAKSYQTLALSILNNTAVLKRLFRKFDLNDDCFIDFSEFIRTIPIPLCHKRVKVLKEAFEALDIDEDSVLTYYDFDKWFRKNNPSFADRPRNDEKLTKIIISCMVNFNGNLEPLKPITREGFIEYYKVVSSTIMNDAYFDLLIRRIHHLE